MKSFTAERSAIIQAPVEAVYAYVADFPRHVEWNHQPTAMTKLTDGPVGVGSVFRTMEQAPSNAPLFFKLFGPLLSKLMGSMGYTEAEITALEPDQRVAWTAKAPLKKGGNFAQAEWEMRFEPQGQSTRVTQAVHFTLLSSMADRMDEHKLARDNGEEMARNLDRLKATLEARATRQEAPNKAALA